MDARRTLSAGADWDSILSDQKATPSSVAFGDTFPLKGEGFKAVQVLKMAQISCAKISNNKKSLMR